MDTIMIKVSHQIADSLSSEDKGDSDGLLKVISEYNATLGSPTGPVGEASLYYSVDNVDPYVRDDLRRALSELPGVDAAYFKPSEETP